MVLLWGHPGSIGTSIDTANLIVSTLSRRSPCDDCSLGRQLIILSLGPWVDVALADKTLPKEGNMWNLDVWRALFGPIHFSPIAAYNGWDPS